MYDITYVIIYAIIYFIILYVIIYAVIYVKYHIPYILFTFKLYYAGIPESLVISEKVAQLQTAVAEFSNVILNIDSNADSRQETLLNTLPGVVVQEIMSKLTVEGAVPLTSDDLRRSMQANTEALQNFIEDRIRLVHVQNSNTEGSFTTDITTNGATLQLSSNYPHYWNNSHHAVPQNYEFPSTSVKDLWDLWFYGNASMNIAPLRFVKAKFDLNKAWRVRHTRAKYVMVKLLGKCSYSVAEIAMKSRGEADTIFETAMTSLMNASPSIIGKECDDMFVARLFQLSYSTVYKKINEMR